MDSSANSFGTKKDKLGNLEIGMNIWAGLDTFIEGPLELTDFPMTPEQLSLNMVEGNITKKLKHSFDVIFPAISRKKIKLSHSDILGNENTFVDVNDLPIGSVIVRTEAGFDPLVTLAPPIKLKSCGTEFEKISVLEFEERDVQFR